MVSGRACIDGFGFAGAFDEDDMAPGGFDIEVEVEQEGGGEITCHSHAFSCLFKLLYQ